MNTPFLKGERVYMRGLSYDELQGNYINWFNDPEVCLYNSHHRYPYYLQDAESYIQSVQSSKDSLVLAIFDRKENIHIGNIALQSIDLINRNAEFAIILGERSFWGKGYAKEASLIILQHGFCELNLHRIYCGTSELNKPMQLLAEKLYMQQEGRRKQALFKNGTYLDIIEYGLLKDYFLEVNKKKQF